MNEKLENLLRLALETPLEVREQTQNLNTGFDAESRSWELIVKYHGSLAALSALGIEIEYLIAGYAILTVPEELVEIMAELEEIEYVEKPKRFFYSMPYPAEYSCLPQVTLRQPFLNGSGVLVAVLDSGIEWRRNDFRNDDGSTRIRYLWDQTLRADAGAGNDAGAGADAGVGADAGTGNDAGAENDAGAGADAGVGNDVGVETDAVRRGMRPPEGFAIGVEFTAEQINQALQAASEAEQFALLPSRDVSGHGTAVAGIAAASVGTEYGGVASQSELLIVKLGIPGELGFPRTTEIMRGVAYALSKAEELQMPVAINLSFGNNYGSHDGSSLLERFLDNAAEIGRTVICVGSGNEGNTGGHIAGNVEKDQTVSLAVAEYETDLSVQIWKNYKDVYRIFLRSPGGQVAELTTSAESGKYTLQLEQTEILVYLGEPTPYAVAQEIYFEMLPVGTPYVNSGVWTITLEPISAATGQYYMYLPGTAVRNERTGFYQSTPQMTLTIPSTAAKVITVGAYNTEYNAYADFSGRGYASPERTVGVVRSGLTKPDLVAPGVSIIAPDTYGGYVPVTGTSFATPIATGSAALLMEWGITRGNDPFLYGEKVKAYLRRGAQPLRGETEYPNEKVGWGALCVRDSLPV